MNSTIVDALVGLADVAREVLARRNREAFPAIAEILSHFRSVFGPGVRLVCGQEGKRKIGKTPKYWPRNF